MSDVRHKKKPRMGSARGVRSHDERPPDWKGCQVRHPPRQPVLLPTGAAQPPITRRVHETCALSQTPRCHTHRGCFSLPPPSPLPLPPLPPPPPLPRDAPAADAAAEPVPGAAADAAATPGGKISSCPASTAAGCGPGAVAIAPRGCGDRRPERPMVSRRDVDDGGVTIVTRAIEQRQTAIKGAGRGGRAEKQEGGSSEDRVPQRATRQNRGKEAQRR